MDNENNKPRHKFQKRNISQFWRDFFVEGCRLLLEQIFIIETRGLDTYLDSQKISLNSDLDEMEVWSSVANPGSSFLSIEVTGSNNSNKRKERGKFFFCRHKYNKTKNCIIFDQVQIWANSQWNVVRYGTL